ncbi:chromosome segregation protein SMC [Piscirickettsia salmonis]|uniref:Chromosome segregation protein SMC n=1 Tax=Piscirickettsia salmonis TaxID=1238 RepID=A0A9Q6LK36_PISSA|nr:hypothetical protein [Piscirickettsia salmonis]QGN95423.1 chromosome segregation protein SMC [Piscirickettsia salmonis]QGO05628.1 chromosome segregation protein SMC [Piscirickettsia salmonis]QGO33949.1 chromosome segregation protein SMC [Piscirickettsia salmonis]QGO37559.1 chromosome segregation protein SMC [Piscirickettsia salmonis]QGO41187.1 chromosome segregation protein SMC [Piscirickettsia salmonis]
MPQMTFESLPHTQKAIVVQLAANVATYANENPDSFLGFQFASVLGKEKNKYFSATFLHDKDGEEVEARSILQQMKDFEKLKTDISYAGYESDDGEDEASDQDHEREERDHHRREHTHAKSTESRALAPLNLSKFKNLADLALAVIDFEHGKHGENFYKTVAQPLLQSLRKAIKKEDEALDFLVIGADKRLEQQLSQVISDLEQAHERLKQLQTAHRALQAKQAIQEGAQQQQATELAEINAQLTQAQATVTVTQANQSLKTELTTTQEQLQQAQATAAKAHKKSTRLETEKAAQAVEFEHQLTLSKSETEQEREKSARLQQRLEPLEAESSRLRGENSALRAEVTELRQSNSSQAAALTDARDGLAIEQSKSQGLETEKASLTAKVVDLTGQLESSREDLQQSQTQLSELRQTLTAANTGLKDELAQAQARSQEAANTHDHARENWDKERQALEAVQRTQAEKVADLTKKNQALSGQLTTSHDEKATLQTQVAELTADNDQLTDTNTTLVRQLASTQEEVRQAKASLPSRKDLEKQRAIIDLMPRLREGDARHLKSNLYSVISDRLERGEAFDKELFPKLIAAFTTNTGNWVSWRDNSTTAGQLLDGLKENSGLAKYLGVEVNKKTKQKDLRATLGTQNDEFKKLKSKDEHLVFFKLSTIEKNHQASQHTIVEPRT